MVQNIILTVTLFTSITSFPLVSIDGYAGIHLNEYLTSKSGHMPTSV